MCDSKSMGAKELEKKKKGTCLCRTESLYCTIETSTTLLNTYTPIKDKALKKQNPWSISFCGLILQHTIYIITNFPHILFLLQLRESKFWQEVLD